MTYTVVWLTSAENQFKAICRNAEDPGEILGAARRIEAELLRKAHDVGESRDAMDDRIIIDRPLGLRFWVSRLDRVTAVVAVWRIH